MCPPAASKPFLPNISHVASKAGPDFFQFSAPASADAATQAHKSHPAAQLGAKRAMSRYTAPACENNDGPCAAWNQISFQEEHDPPRSLLQT